MFKALSAALLSAGLIAAAPADAYQILPNLFANRYCELRAVGVGQDDAMRAAMRESMINEPALPTVTSNGKTYTADVLLATNAVVRLCPQWMPR